MRTSFRRAVVPVIGSVLVVLALTSCKVPTTPVTSPTASDSATPTASATPTVEPTTAAPTEPPISSPAPVLPSTSVVIQGVQWTGSAVEGGAFMPDIIEDGGVCTLTISNGGTTLSGTSAGFADAKVSYCEPISISDGVSAGSWTATFSYSSPAYVGVSESTTFEVN